MNTVAPVLRAAADYIVDCGHYRGAAYDPAHVGTTCAPASLYGALRAVTGDDDFDAGMRFAAAKSYLNTYAAEHGYLTFNDFNDDDDNSVLHVLAALETVAQQIENTDDISYDPEEVRAA